MTTDVVPVAVFPTGDQADETVRLTIKALMKGRGISADELAIRMSIGRSAIYTQVADETLSKAICAIPGAA